MLKTADLVKNFGSLRAVDQVTLEIEEGEIRAIIGPNGAGKSTLLDLITNRSRPSSGHIFFKGEDITGLPPYRIARKGIGKCFQISKLFPDLTAFENIQIACISKRRKVYDFFSARNRQIESEAVRILNSIGLDRMKEEFAGYLSYGDQRRLEIGITLAMMPTLLLLDEPTAGVSRGEGNELMRLVKELAAERSLTIVFIEHDMDMVFHYADKISVMHQGAIIATGRPDEIKNNKLVQDIYLGEKTI